MFCEKCGAKVPEGSKFCENCGAKIDWQDTADNVNASQVIETEKRMTEAMPPTPVPTPTTPSSGNVKIVLIAVVAVFVVLGIGVAVFAVRNVGRIKDMAEEQIDSVETEDMDWDFDEVEESDSEAEVEKEQVEEVYEFSLSDYCGAWDNLVSDRCHMEIIASGGQTCLVTVDWGSSAWENAHWEYGGKYKKGEIKLKSGRYIEQVYDDNGTETDNIIQSGLTGRVYFGSDGYLYIDDGMGKLTGYNFGYAASQEQYSQDEPASMTSSSFEQLMNVDASQYIYTESDLAALTPQELTYLRNSIYAAYGYVFDSSELNSYFSQFDWYTPNPSVDGSELNGTEKQNVEFIRSYQENNGKMYKPQ